MCGGQRGGADSRIALTSARACGAAPPRPGPGRGGGRAPPPPPQAAAADALEERAERFLAATERALQRLDGAEGPQ